jgi:hypothetical protein
VPSPATTLDCGLVTAGRGSLRCGLPSHKQHSRQRHCPTFVIPTGAKRSGGICSVPSPATTLDCGLVTAGRGTLRCGLPNHKHHSRQCHCPTFVIPTGAKRSGGICSVPSPQTNPLCKQHAPDSQGQSRMSLLHLRVVAGEGTLQIPPLRFAPVGMTSWGRWHCLECCLCLGGF